MRKEEIIGKLDHIKTIIISAATYGTSEEVEYKQLRKELIECSIIKSVLPLVIKSNRTTDEARSYMQGLFAHYDERRRYITDEINKAIVYLEEYGTAGNELIEYEKTGWEKIDESVKNLSSSVDSITDRISYNEIGVRCRETIILLANQVYIDEIHHPKDYLEKLSKTDSKRMIDGYLDYSFPGSGNQEKRSYAKSCNTLANFLTHGQNLNVLDAKLCINATISLIQIIKLIDQHNKKKGNL